MIKNKHIKLNFDLVAIATSAGGLKALSEIFTNLPADFPATLLVVQHVAPQYKSRLAEILTHRTALQVKQAEQGELVKKGTIYLAPPNYHLLIKSDHTLQLTQSELVHFLRPCADLLFNSVAEIYQNRAIAVVLTGTGTDGEKGVQTIKKKGGIVIAQNKESSEHFGMPSSAIATGVVDYILPLGKIPECLISLVTKDKINDQS
jgi:two-component system, chemotaxis family, protein-glutamate methylesterase/glutaminase